MTRKKDKNAHEAGGKRKKMHQPTEKKKKGKTSIIKFSSARKKKWSRIRVGRKYTV